jgi:segregation and condensation protein A
MPELAADPTLDLSTRCHVATPVFEGPFDLLLHLILREQVDIYEISLTLIVDAYLAELDRMRQQETALDLDVATEFLLIAATLVELKARRLLPGRDDIELDEELALWEERDLLLARLLDVAPDLLAGVTPADLKAAFLRAVAPKPVPRVDLFHVTNIRASVTDAVSELLDELPRVGRISFRRLTQSLVDRLEVVVRFLALLELFKQGLVELDQSHAFGDIEIVWRAGDGDADEEHALALIDAYDG